MKKLLLICLSSLFVSCSVTSKIIEVPVEVAKHEYIVKEVHDTTIINNFIDRWKNGDTVYIKENHSIYKYIYKNDTIKVIDSIPVYLKETTQIEVNKLKWWQKPLIWMGVLFLILIIYKMIKLIISIYKKCH